MVPCRYEATERLDHDGNVFGDLSCMVLMQSVHVEVDSPQRIDFYKKHLQHFTNSLSWKSLIMSKLPNIIEEVIQVYKFCKYTKMKVCLQCWIIGSYKWLTCSGIYPTHCKVEFLHRTSQDQYYGSHKSCVHALLIKLTYELLAILKTMLILRHDK